jgi:hypothetical protein
MKMRGMIWLGIALIASGFGLFAGRSIRSKTKNSVPVDMPILLTEGLIRTPVFKTNQTALYIIQIEVEKTLPLETLNCLLGIEHVYVERCRTTPSVIRASWALLAQGVVVAHGYSGDSAAGGWQANAVSRQIGSFISKQGQQYVLEVKMLSNASPLAVGRPRLKVGVHPMQFETAAFADIPYLFAAGGLVLIGATVIVIGAMKKRQSLKQRVTT